MLLIFKTRLFDNDPLINLPRPLETMVAPPSLGRGEGVYLWFHSLVDPGIAEAP